MDVISWILIFWFGCGLLAWALDQLEIVAMYFKWKWTQHGNPVTKPYDLSEAWELFIGYVWFGPIYLGMCLKDKWWRWS
ncbi:MAG TPA: hypothetical protein VEA59_06600 [Patescibacteria group bacterium]|nr:hypothetical protein [Patescibacteria group bacterium]